MKNTFSTPKLRHILPIIVLACACLQAQAACQYFDKFKDNRDGTVTDPRSGLIWKRCAENFEWTGTECKGSDKKLDWPAAMQTAKQSQFLGKSDWRIPTKAEFESVLGAFNDCQGDRYKKGEYAASKMIAHMVSDKKAAMEGNVPAGVFWSSSPNKSDVVEAWDADFTFGYVGESKRRYSRSVRLVRSIKSPGTDAAREFDSEYSKIEEYKNAMKQK